ncbi:MAG TPA: glycoside hydrolase family 99-like domain-containing protein [Kiritimatiellia bacterium]|nr:glycoside hydrolase family 99-like domain-containing protein [Kiritimatiellia bacterium]
MPTCHTNVSYTLKVFIPGNQHAQDITPHDHTLNHAPLLPLPYFHMTTPSDEFDVRLLDAARLEPLSLKQPDAWCGHLPFAVWLVKTLKPGLLVELGTHTGNSFFAFCQAVQEDGLPTRCFAVDTWKGDEHTGHYDESTYNAVRDHQQKHYHAFSTLLRMTFDEARSHFEDGSIDVLHIDGLHTYEAVKHDFESWLPKLHPQGIVLFHDIFACIKGFGVWRFWNELKSMYPAHLEFAHSYGLGVLQTAPDFIHPDMRRLRDGMTANPGYSYYIAAVSTRYIDTLALAARTTEVDALRSHIAHQSATLNAKDQHLNSLQTSVSQRDACMESLFKQVSARDKQLTELHAQIREQNAHLVHKDEQLNDLHAAISQRDAQIATLAMAQQEYSEVSRMIALMLRSRSWRWTWPLRWLADSVDRLRAPIMNDRQRSKAQQPPPAAEASPPLLPSAPDILATGNISPQSAEVMPESPDSPPGPEQWWAGYEAVSKKVSIPPTYTPSEPLAIIHIDDDSMAWEADTCAFAEVTNPVLSIIIPVHNQVKFTLECLLSIQKTHQEGVALEVIVADGGSSDQTNDILPRIKGLRYLRREQQAGFQENCNRASEVARGEYLLFLNNDTQLMPGAIAAMLRLFHERPDAGIVGPKFLFPSGHLQEAGGRIRRDGTVEMVGLNEDPDLPKYNVIRAVDYCSGACLMVSAKHFAEWGRFSDDYAPAYYEDVDLCLKARRAGYHVYYQPEAVVVHHVSTSYDQAGTFSKIEACTKNRITLLDKWHDTLDQASIPRLIAFYLPQFHPIPENDLWWGSSFTEWRNVVAATPVYAGHLQPRLPAELGFYDLRVPEVMTQQAEMAKQFGIHGFCYYYYWFQGKRLLELPLERMLASGKPDMPFCICWANENWTRRWDGREHEVLMQQEHTLEDDEAVIRDMIRFMRDDRYIKIDGRPLLLIYRVLLFPDIQRTTEVWRDVCRREGIGEICLAAPESFGDNIEVDPKTYGFDFAVSFPPHGTPYRNSCPDLKQDRESFIYRYRDMIEHHTGLRRDHLNRFLSVCPGWDNTPRRKKGSTIFSGSTPGDYQAWLEWAIVETKRRHQGDNRVVFINAWNEWGEGAFLEPDQYYGAAYLEATRNALFNAAGK